MKSKIPDTGILQSSFEGAADTLKRLTLIGEDVPVTCPQLLGHPLSVLTPLS
jgi:hypothetical protein